MKAWFWVKLVVGLAAIGAVFFVGYVSGATSIGGEVDQVQFEQLTSCLPISSTAELSNCTGVKIVQGQP